MKRETFDECFRWIEKFHGKQGQISAEARLAWEETFLAEHDEVFCEAAQYATQKLAPGMFPTIERMRGFIAEAREKLWQKVKDGERQQAAGSRQRARPPEDHRNLGHGKSALAAIFDVLMHRRDPVEAYEEMAANFPGKGWEEVVVDVKLYRAERAAAAEGANRLTPHEGSAATDAG